MNDLHPQLGSRPTAHLNDDQFAECLTASTPRPSVQAHLAQCDACRLELGLFLSSIEQFSAAALQWSKAQPSSNLQSSLGGSLAPRSQLFAPVRWALACAAILAVAVPVALHRNQPEVYSGGAAFISDSSDSPTQIAQDNRLLQSVDLVLGQADPSPWQEYRLDDPHDGSSQPNSSTRMRDE